MFQCKSRVRTAIVLEDKTSRAGIQATFKLTSSLWAQVQKLIADIEPTILRHDICGEHVACRYLAGAIGEKEAQVEDSGCYAEEFRRLSDVWDISCLCQWVTIKLV